MIVCPNDLKILKKIQIKFKNYENLCISHDIICEGCSKNVNEI
jgi:hypothetical protein